MTIGYIGLGKMGIGMVRRLREKGIGIVAFNRSLHGRAEAKKCGAKISKSIPELISELPKPRTVWLMVSHQAVEEVVRDLIPQLSKGDTVIDGGNSFYESSVKIGKLLSGHGVNFLDVGVSGGPSGARNGACVMVGGDKKIFNRHLKLFNALVNGPGNLLYAGNQGAGHFVKMIHNGIEYGMMQSIAEGFAVLKKSPYKLKLQNLAGLYNNGSVIESRLIGWLQKAYKTHGEDLNSVSGSVAHSGEGLWSVRTAEKLKVPVTVIEKSLMFRVDSQKSPSYTGKILTAIRNQFGGHSLK